MRQQVLNLLSDVCGNDEILSNMDLDLFETEILDSLAFLDLLERLEDDFDIIIQPTQVSRESWQTPNLIVDLVMSYK